MLFCLEVEGREGREGSSTVQGRVQCSVELGGWWLYRQWEHPVGFLEPGSTRETGTVLTRESSELRLRSVTLHTTGQSQS